MSWARTLRTGAIVVVIAACNSKPSPLTRDDAGARPHREHPRKPDAGATVAAKGKEHAEIKGSIRRAKADGSRVEEAGGHGELDPIQSLWGSGPTDIYAAAWDDPGHGLLHSKGDGTWTHEGVPARRLHSVWGSGPHDIYAGDNDGAIYHGHGDGTWTLEHERGGAMIAALWGSGPKDIYAATARGKVLHSTGAGTWTEESVGDDHVLLFAVWGSGPTDLYAAGDDAKIFHSTGGGHWKLQQQLPGDAHAQVTAIWGAGAKDVYAVATGLFHSAGDGVWTAVPIDGLGSASSVWGDGKDTLWVGGSDGSLFVRRKGAWTHTADKDGGTYQALWGTGDDLYIGAERFLTWTTPD